VLVQGPIPSVTAISHQTRKAGEFFELLGANFGDDESEIRVKIGSTIVPVARLADDRITLRVPTISAGTYIVTLSANGQMAPQRYTLVIENTIPVLTNVSPATVAPGSSFTLTGQGFGMELAAIQVRLGNLLLVPSSITETKIIAMVPATLKSGMYMVSVLRNGISSIASKPLEVLKMPSFLNFDDNNQQWTSTDVTVTRDSVHTSTGNGASLSIGGSGYRVIHSPRFNTADIGQFSDTISFDVFIPSNPSNIFWLGEIAFYVDAPAVGLNNAFQGKITLTGNSTGAWHTVRIPLSTSVVQAIAGDYPNMQFSIVLNAAAAGGSYGLDAIEFVGANLQYRTIEHQIASRNLNVYVPAKLGFESTDPWTIPLTANGSYVPEPREQGKTALRVAANGFMHFESPRMSAFELQSATQTVNVDLYIPDPQPNPWWLGNLSAYVNCPTDGINNQYLGQKDLTHLFRKEYNGIQFEIPAAILLRLQQSIGGCHFLLDLNVTNGPAPFLLDKMGFVHSSGEVITDPIEPTTSSSSTASSSSSHGSGSSFVCSGMCAGALPALQPYQTNNLGTTGEVWFVTETLPRGWQASEMANRTIEVNGIAMSFGQTPLPPSTNGKWYFHFSPGTHSWASWSWWP
jgi:hypothetical protein